MTSSPVAAMTTRPAPRPRGFAIPGNASAAARKGHALGRAYCHEWTPPQAVDNALKAARPRRFAAAFLRAGGKH